jgi:hypothetical protein
MFIKNQKGVKMGENCRAEFEKKLDKYTETLLWGTEESLRNVVYDFEAWVKDNLYDLSKIRDYSMCLKISDILLPEKHPLAWKILIIALKGAKDFDQFEKVVERLQSLKRYVYTGNKMPYEHIAKIGYSLAQKDRDYIFLYKVLENNVAKLFVFQIEKILESRNS